MQTIDLSSAEEQFLLASADHTRRGERQFSWLTIGNEIGLSVREADELSHHLELNGYLHRYGPRDAQLTPDGIKVVHHSTTVVEDGRVRPTRRPSRSESTATVEPETSPALSNQSVSEASLSTRPRPARSDRAITAIAVLFLLILLACLLMQAL